MTDPQPEQIPVSNTRTPSLKNLFLDPNNFRFIDHEEYVTVPPDRLLEDDVQRRTAHMVRGPREQNIQDLIASFKENGFLAVDQIQARPLGNGKYLVVEGNRRVSTLKFLLSRYEETGAFLGQLNPAIFKKVPVVVYEDAEEEHHLILMGLKHISGNKKWPSINQARLLYRLLHNHNKTEKQITDSLGITTHEFRRSLRALALTRAYQESEFSDQFESEQYSLFRELISSPKMRAWLQWDDNKYQTGNAVNRDRLFSWLSKVVDENEDGDTVTKEPALSKSGDVKLLIQILDDERALSNLEVTRNLSDAAFSSDVLGQNKFKNALSIAQKQVDTAFEFVGFAHEQDHADLLAFQKKVNGLLATKGGPTVMSPVRQLSPFNSLVSQHFDHLTVTEFKKLRNLTLRDIGRINIIAGINNSGKTTLLEAIYLLTQQNDANALLELVRRRAKIKTDVDPQWLLAQLPAKCAISGNFDQNAASLEIRTYREESFEGGGVYLGTVEINSQFANRAQESRTRLYENRDRETAYKGVKTLCLASFSSPFSSQDPEQLARYYEASLEANTLPRILDFITESVDSHIKDINLANRFNRFWVSHDRKSGDLTGMGEGLQRIFHIALQFAYASHGVLLIDEFENAIHTELLHDFTVFVQKLAREFNVQVFLTSHSKECIDAFVQNGFALEDITGFSLVTDEDEIVCKRVKGPRLAELLELMDADLRKAR